MTNINPQNQNNIVIKEDCFDYGGDWVNYFYNFDNIGNAL